MSSSGATLAIYYPSQRYTIVKADVSSASSVYIYGYMGTFAYNQGPQLQISSISFSN